MKPTAEPFSAIDAAWLHMESPTNLMVIAGFFTFDDVMDGAALRTVLEERLLPYRRFRQRVVDPGFFRSPRWELDEAFTIDRHLDETTLPGAGDERAFRELVDRLVAEPLPFDRPLWHVTLIGNYRDKSAAFFRIHHAIADGMALLRVLLSICDGTDDPPNASAEPFRPGRSVVAGAKRFAGTALADGFELLRNPHRALDLADRGAGYAKALARLTLLPPDAPTPLRGSLGATKRAAWTEPIPIDEVKQVAAAGGATVNDVIASHVAGALGRYLERNEHAGDTASIRAMIPVDIRPLDRSPELGNQFGLVLPALPIGIGEHAERLAAVKAEMDFLKGSPEAAVSFAILQTMGATASEVQRLIVGFFAAKASLVLTNVPGPREPLAIAGHRIRRMMFWVPRSGRLGMGISIISYAGEIAVGVVTDELLVPDPQAIVAELHAIHVETADAAGLRPRAIRTRRPRCVAMTRSGSRCRNGALTGSTTCRAHIARDRQDRPVDPGAESPRTPHR